MVDRLATISIDQGGDEFQSSRRLTVLDEYRSSNRGRSCLLKRLNLFAVDKPGELRHVVAANQNIVCGGIKSPPPVPSITALLQIWCTRGLKRKRRRLKL